MPHLDNPAGRLHALLAELTYQQNGLNTVVAGWAGALDVAESDVILHIGSVANLVPQIVDAVGRLEDEALIAPVARLRGTWSRAIFPLDHQFNGELRAVLPGEEALESLALVSASLHLLAPEGTVPGGPERANLGNQLRDLVEEISRSDDLPDELKQVLVSRLLDVDTAIAHIRVGGPASVQRAMEAVMGTVMFTAAEKRASQTSTMQKLWVALGVIWVAFSAGPKIQDSIEAWPKIVHEISSGQVVPADKDQPDQVEGVVDAGAPTREPPN